MLGKLAELGYSNEDNEVLASPNDDFNIKYGGLPDTMLAEIAAALKAEFHADFLRSKDFGDTNRQVFINLPKGR